MEFCVTREEDTNLVKGCFIMLSLTRTPCIPTHNIRIVLRSSQLALNKA